MSIQEHKCKHPIGQCKIVDVGATPNVNLPNSFNIVLDEDDDTKCHVLQFEPDYKEKYESLVLKIKELIEDYKKGLGRFEVGSEASAMAKLTITVLQNLINPVKELTKEEIE